MINSLKLTAYGIGNNALQIIRPTCQYIIKHHAVLSSSKNSVNFPTPKISPINTRISGVSRNSSLKKILHIA